MGYFTEVSYKEVITYTKKTEYIAFKLLIDYYEKDYQWKSQWNIYVEIIKFASGIIQAELNLKNSHSFDVLMVWINKEHWKIVLYYKYYSLFFTVVVDW